MEEKTTSQTKYMKSLRNHKAERSLEAPQQIVTKRTIERERESKCEPVAIGTSFAVTRCWGAAWQSSSHLAGQNFFTPMYRKRVFALFAESHSPLSTFKASSLTAKTERGRRSGEFFCFWWENISSRSFSLLIFFCLFFLTKKLKVFFSSCSNLSWNLALLLDQIRFLFFV